MIQWGLIKGHSNTSQTVTLPRAYTNTAYIVVPVYEIPANCCGQGVHFAYPSLTTFVLSTDNYVQIYLNNIQKHWISIGF